MIARVAVRRLLAYDALSDYNFFLRICGLSSLFLWKVKSNDLSISLPRSHVILRSVEQGVLTASYLETRSHNTWQH